MEAKETVMSDKQIEAVIRKRFPVFELNEEGEEERKLATVELLEAQAEISFKAGFNAGYSEGHEFSYEDGKKAGARKVVEWVRAQWEATPYERLSDRSPIIQIQIAKADWQAFVKELGLEEGT